MLVIVSELFNMLDAGALLFISLTPVWFGGLTALYSISTCFLHVSSSDLLFLNFDIKFVYLADICIVMLHRGLYTVC